MKKTLLALIAAVALAGCNQTPGYYQSQGQVQYQQPAVVAAPATVVVHDHDSGGAMLTGMMMGHMMASHSVYHAAPVIHQTTVVNKTVIVQRSRPAPMYARSTPARASFGSFRRR